MTKRTPATDVTLSPSLAEFLLELVDSSIILLLQAKHREILSPPCLLVNRLTLTSAQCTGNPVGQNLCRSLFLPGLPPSYMNIHLQSLASPRSLHFLALPCLPCSFSPPNHMVFSPPNHATPRPSALTDSRGDIRLPAQRRSRESRR